MLHDNESVLAAANDDYVVWLDQSGPLLWDLTRD